MIINTSLIQGTGKGLASCLASWTSSTASVTNNQLVISPPKALVLLSLGADYPTLLNAVEENNVACPIYLSETYGILGYDESLKRNVELLEKGRGSEYGYPGGSGGQGVVAISYHGDHVVSGHDELSLFFGSSQKQQEQQKPSSIMVIADGSKSFDKKISELEIPPPLYYGGITKQSWIVSPSSANNDDDLKPISYFWVGETKQQQQQQPDDTGVVTFAGNAEGAAQGLLNKIPTNRKPTGQVFLGPCFTLGENEYGRPNVETDAIVNVMQKQEDNKEEPTRIYGMFAHGELGPTLDFTAGFDTTNDDSPNGVKCMQHGHTSILAIHTTATMTDALN